MSWNASGEQKAEKSFFKMTQDGQIRPVMLDVSSNGEKIPYFMDAEELEQVRQTRKSRRGVVFTAESNEDGGFKKFSNDSFHSSFITSENPQPILSQTPNERTPSVCSSSVSRILIEPENIEEIMKCLQPPKQFLHQKCANNLVPKIQSKITLENFLPTKQADNYSEKEAGDVGDWLVEERSEQTLAYLLNAENSSKTSPQPSGYSKELSTTKSCTKSKKFHKKNLSIEERLKENCQSFCDIGCFDDLSHLKDDEKPQILLHPLCTRESDKESKLKADSISSGHLCNSDNLQSDLHVSKEETEHRDLVLEEECLTASRQVPLVVKCQKNQVKLSSFLTWENYLYTTSFWLLLYWFLWSVYTSKFRTE